MGLETSASASIISGLDATFPLDGDNISDLDGHLRILKYSLQKTFPAIAGAVSASAGDLNLLAGTQTSPLLSQGALVFLSDVTSDLQAQIDALPLSSHVHPFIEKRSGLGNILITDNEIWALVRFINSATYVVLADASSTATITLGTEIVFFKDTTGVCTFSDGPQCTINSIDGKRDIAGQYGDARLRKTGNNVWLLTGDLA